MYMEKSSKHSSESVGESVATLNVQKFLNRTILHIFLKPPYTLYFPGRICGKCYREATYNINVTNSESMSFAISF